MTRRRSGPVAAPPPAVAWEVLHTNRTSMNATHPETTDRLRVDGGWLYRTTHFNRGACGVYAQTVAMVFVADVVPR